MAFDPVIQGEQAEKAPSPPVFVVFSRDGAIVEAVRKACSPLGLKCLHFKNPERLSKAFEAEVVAVAWDAGSFPFDWERTGELVGRCGTLVMLGPPSPSPAPVPGLPVVNLPAALPLETLGGCLALAAEGALGRQRLREANSRAHETQRRLDEANGLARARQEQVDFYEMQRGQLAEVVKRTAYLGQLSKEINCLDPDRIVDICVTKVPTLVDATLASVYMVNQETGELLLKQSNHPYRVTDRIAIDAAPPGLMALAIEKKATLLIRDVDAFAQNLKVPLSRVHAAKYRNRSCIIVPLMNDNRPIAVLNLSDKTTGAPFDEVKDLPLVDHISQFIGIALGNCQLYQKVWQLAKTDALTGFMNHNAFFDELHREIARVRRSRTDLSVVILDIDNFKLFNDVHGHQVGDMILTQVAGLIRNNVRTEDVAARYGGDEFALILSDTDLERAETVAERIRRAIAANQLTLDAQTFFVTISAGIAQYAMGQTLAEVVNEADTALYRAKSRGRNAIAAGSRT